MPEPIGDAGGKISARVGRIAIEGATIVFSILLAFGIDACWARSQEAERATAHMLALRRQFEDVHGAIQREIADLTAAAGATRELLGMTPEVARREGPDSLAELFYLSFRPGRVHLPSGALDALLASGELSLIADHELGRRLAAWPSLAAEAFANAGLLVEDRERDLAPFVHRYVGGLHLGHRTGLLEGFPPSRFPFAVTPLFADPLLEGHLSNRAIRIQVTLLRYQQLAAEADTIISLIQSHGSR